MIISTKTTFRFEIHINKFKLNLIFRHLNHNDEYHRRLFLIFKYALHKKEKLKAFLLAK